MAKLPRIYQRLFGSTANANEIKQFGSLAASASMSTTDPAVMQSLSQWLNGWFSAVLAGNSPTIEDMNAFCFVVCYQLGYLFQAGVAEWDATTIYYTGSLASSAGVVYVSLTDNNTNHAVTDQTNWAVQGNRVNTQTTTYTVAQSDNLIRGNTTGGAFTATLPAVASTPIGKRYTLKNVGTGGFNLTVKGNASENIDGANTQILSANGFEFMTVINNGTSWDIVG